jgi:N,N'-diacetyllegionaminate synthase
MASAECARSSFMTRTPIKLVAEAAQGFEGDPRQALLLARAAAAGGADLVKFQLVYADELALPGYRYYELFRSLEMSDADWHAVRTEADSRNIGLAFDVFGHRSLALALSLGARVVKIHATDFFNDALVRDTLSAAPEVHLSLGGIREEEIAAFFTKHAALPLDKIVLMGGYQAEPTPIGVNNLARLGALRARFPRQRVGWMDHADGAADEAGWLGVVAVPFGISVLEKHLTLARPLELEDGVSALDPAAFREYAKRVRIAEQAVGDASLALTPDESAYRRRALKSVVATTDLRAGQSVPAGELVLKRAALHDGRYPLQQLDRAVGKKLAKDVAAGSAIYEDDVS